MLHARSLGWLLPALLVTVLAVPAPAALAAETCGTATGAVTLIPGQHDDLAVDTDGRTAYVPSHEGQLHAVAVPSGELRCPLQLGAAVRGLDLGNAPGQLFAAVGAEIVQVDTVGWRVVRRYPLGLAVDEQALDVGITSSGRALVSTSAHRVVELVLASGVMSAGNVVSDIYMGKIESSRDHSVLAIAGIGESGGAVAVYRADTGAVVRRNLYRSFADVSIDGTGTRIALSGPRGVALLDGAAQVLGTAPSVAHGAAISADGRAAWSLYRDGVARAVDVTRGGVLTGSTFLLPGTYDQRGSGDHVGTAVLAPGGQLVVLTDDGVAVGQPSSASAPTPAPGCGGALDAAGWARLAGPGGAVAVADDSRTAWVAVPSENVVVPIDLVDRVLGCAVPVGSSPRSLAISADGTELLVANGGGEDVAVVDTARRVQERRIRVPWTSGDAPSVVVAGPDGGGLLLTHHGNGYTPRLVRFDAAGASTSLRDVRDGQRLAGSGDRRRAITSLGGIPSMQTSLLDLPSGDVLRTRDLGETDGAFPREHAVDDTAATSLVARFVSGRGPEATVLDETLAAVGALRGDSWGITLAPSGDRGWSTFDGQAYEIDLSSRTSPTVLRSLAVPDLTQQSHDAAGDVRISRDGRSLVVLTQSGVAVLGPTGSGPTAGTQQPAPSSTPATSPSPVPSTTSATSAPAGTPESSPAPATSGSTGTAGAPGPAASPAPAPSATATQTPGPTQSTAPAPAQAAPSSPAGSSSPSAVPAGASGGASAAPAVASGTGLFHPSVPTRVYDSRRAGGRIVAGSDRVVRLAGVGGVPAQGVQAVVVNVTAVGSTTRSDLQVYPLGRRPAARTSSLNLRPGPPVAGLVTAVLGQDGAISLSTAGGAVDVVLDVLGWYGEARPSAAAFSPATPARVFDSRRGGGPVAAGQDRAVQITGLAGVPAAATAVAVNVTVTGSSAPSDLQVYPSGERPPVRTSTLNMSRATTVANLAVVKLGADGRLAVSTAGGATHVILDVVGWYAPPTAAEPGSRFVPVDPMRALDTRPARAPVRAEQDRLLVVPAAPPGASAVAGTITAVGATRSLDLQVYPEGRRPAGRTSTVNVPTGAAVPNGFVSALGDGGGLRLSASAGAVHVIVDITGWFTRSG